MGTYTITSHAGTGLPLCVSAEGIVYARTNVSIGTVADNDVFNRRWAIEKLGAGQQALSLNNPKYMLNAQRSTWNCDIMTSNSDTYINFIYVSSEMYRLQLKSDTSRYLTATGTASGSNVTWETLNGTNAQVWKVKELEPEKAGIATLTQVTIGKFPLNIISTKPGNIVLATTTDNPKGPIKYLKNSGFYGINGSFFGLGDSKPVVLNITANYGKAIGPLTDSKENGSKNGFDCGQDAIAYYQGALHELFQVANLCEVKSQLSISEDAPEPVWVQGGASFRLGDKDWQEQWSGGHEPDTSTTGHSALVVDTMMKKVHLIVAQTTGTTISDFRSALLEYFKITDGNTASTRYKGIRLDGSHSSSMVARGEYGMLVIVESNTPRAVSGIIALKESY